ncbi:MAG: hypothetical protein H3C48_06615 [Chitinophagaceae bacterium]|nr:hypothetical protein [Chitinophagaceae bacterium]
MLFKEVIGQHEVKQQLIQMVQQNRLSHALLFLGKEGSGALPLALAFANYVCLSSYNRAESPASLFDDPSGKSGGSGTPVINSWQEADNWMQRQPAWSKVSGMIHPDIHYSYPTVPRKSGDKTVSTDYVSEWRSFIKESPYGNGYDWLQYIKAENRQGNITVHECNDIIRKLSLKSFESGFKILVMWLPEFLGGEGNKLLKIIEEPPENTLFILVAENEHLILPTILSRTQLVKVPALEEQEVEEALVSLKKISAEQARQIAFITEGNYREALLWLQQGDDDWLELLRGWLNPVIKMNPLAQVKWIEEIASQGREKQKQFIRYFIQLLEQAIRIHIIGDATVQLTEPEKDFVLKFNRFASFDQMEIMITELNNAIYYIERNANAKILFHALTIKLYHIIVKKEKVELR